MGNHGDCENSNGRVRRKTAHVIVCGNEKGGSGKTTTAMHIAISLMKMGFRVASIDLDTRQQSLSRYVQNRQNWSWTRRCRSRTAQSCAV